MEQEELAEAINDIVSDETEEVETEVETPEEEPETEEADEQEEPELADEPEADDGAIVVTFGDEEDEDEGSQPFREIRQENRALKKRLRELEQAQTSQEVDQLGPKPALKDFDYDEAKFEDALDAWKDQEKAIKAKAEEKRQADERMAAEYQEKLSNYRNAAKALGAKDFDEAEAAVKDTIPEVVQSIIVDNAENPALLTYALGKNPDLMESLPKGKTFRDAVTAAYMLAKLETKVRTAKVKAKPKPETAVKGGAKSLKTGDKRLEELRAEAERTGDMTQVVAYKKKMRAAK